MKQLLDFLPLAVFFSVFWFYDDVFIATKALIITTAFTLTFLWFQFRKAGKKEFKEFLKAEKIPIFTFLLALIFGSLTIYFHELSFLIWKLTIFYGVFAAILLISQFVFNKPIIQKLLGKEISLPARVWSKLNLSWAIFFIICGGVNLYVGFNLSEGTWVTFKTFVFPGVVFIFTLFTGFYIYPYLPKETDKLEETKNADQSKHKD